MKLSHIGIAVKSLKEAVPLYTKILKTEPEHEEEVAEQRVRVVKFKLQNCDIELLEGTAPDSPITKFIEKKGEGIHHVSYEVEDIQGSLDDAKSGGIELINETPRTGADDMLIAFLHPKSTGGVLTEYTQHKK